MPKKVLVLGKGQPTAYSLSSIYAEPAKDIGLDVQWQYKELYYPKDNKGRLAKTVKADLQKEWLQDNVSELDSADIILCTDGAYFKTLTKSIKVDTTAGQVLESNYTKTPVMFLPSVGSYSYNPDKTKEQIEFIFGKLSDWFNGTYTALGTNIIHSEEYPENVLDIKVFLDSLLNQERLYVDIETFSLKLTETGLGTISFSLDEHNGGAFAVDLHPTNPTIVREMLVDFFKQYKGHLVFHKSNFDVMVLIYELFMNKDLTDFNGMMEGMQYLCTNLDDTLVITYLATNSCAGNILGLKQLAAEYAGDWAVDVTDIRSVPLKDLLRYNLVDTLSTAYVYKKYYPRMVQDNQEELYKGLFLDTLRTNIRMQLIGLPIDLNKVSKLKKELEDELNDLETKLRNSQEIQDAEDVLAEQRTIKRNATLKKKVTTVQENHKPFLLTSNQELAVLLYEVMKLPIIEFTDTKQPSTSKKTLKKLQNHTTNQSQNDVLQWLQEYADVQKMLSAFIPAFEQADTNKFGNSYLHGWFNLCGTVSGRLSSSQP